MILIRPSKTTLFILFFLVTLFNIWVHPKVIGQDINNNEDKVTLSVTGSDVGDILSQIAGQVKTHIIFFKTQASEIKISRFTAKNESLPSVLDRLLSNTRMQSIYSAEKKAYIISFKKATSDQTIRGKVVDSKTKIPLPGVTVRVLGTSNGVSTDAGGNFTILVPSEVSSLQVTYLGYSTQNIQLKGSGYYSITLIESSKQLNEVVVSTRRRLNTESSMLIERKNSGVVSDGISAKNIEKTASITTVQALQRVSGITITDDKYVAIRGLGDRSVIAELNGSRLSSSDPDRSSIPLDLVPTALLDNVNVIKTLTPDRPADAAAGIVELKTKSIPDSLVLEFTAQTGANSTIGLGGKFNTFQGGELGALGQFVKTHNLSASFKELSKQYPGGLVELNRLISFSRATSSSSAEAFRIDQIMKRFDPVLRTQYQKVTPNQIYAFNFGNSYKVFNHTLGVVFSLSYYNRTEDQYNAEVNQYSIYKGYVTGSPLINGGLSIPYYTTPNDLYLGKYLSYKENKGTQTLNYGGLLGLTYKFDPRNEISAQYLGSWGAESSGSSLLGAFQNTGIDFPINNQIYQLQQKYRTFNNFNFQGEHKLWNTYWAPQISWSISKSNSNNNQPDNRSLDIANLNQTIYAGPLGAPVGDNLFSYVFGVSHIGFGAGQVTINTDPNGRFYRMLDEKNTNLKVDFTFPTKFFDHKVKFKFGGNYLKKDRVFTENVLRFPYSTPEEYVNANNLLRTYQADVNGIVGYSTIGILNTSATDVSGSPRQVGFLYQTAKSPNNYSGSYLTKAIYGQLDGYILPSLRIIGGVRFELTDIIVHVDTTNVTRDGGFYTNQQPNTNLFVNFNPYYSGTLIYQIHKNMNFRLAYSTSLSRPELREITNIFQYDPFQSATVGGNPKLVNQFNRSEDLRWEWFPSSGEVFSLSAFAKQIRNQLTKTFIYNSQGDITTIPETPIIIYQNDENPGQVWGLEMEVRKNLAKISPIFNHFFLGTNVLLATSSVTKNKERLEASRQIYHSNSSKSPLFEQAPYSVNAYLDYDNPSWGTNITSSFNVVGQRLTRVQLDGTPDIYARPVPLLDIVFSQHMGKRFLLKGFAKNILNAAFEDVYTVPGGNGNFKGDHYTQHRYFRGTEFNLGITFNIF